MVWKLRKWIKYCSVRGWVGCMVRPEGIRNSGLLVFRGYAGCLDTCRIVHRPLCLEQDEGVPVLAGCSKRLQ
jgi:hypothetical protein